MRRLLFLFLLCLLLASAASAQTHPCDTAPPASQSITVNVPHKAQFCSPETDKVEAAIAYVDGVASALMPVTAVGVKSTVSGKVLYETPLFLTSSNRGNHTLTVAAYNRDAAGVSQAGPQSPPFAFAVVDEFPLQVSLAVDRAAPQAPGTAITLTATAQGGNGPYQYKFYISQDGGATWDFFTWWQAENIKVWTPSAPCDCRVAVWARSASTTEDVAEATSPALAYAIAVVVPPVPKPGAPVLRGLVK